MTKFEEQYKALANAIAQQAEAIANRTIKGSVYAQVKLLKNNILTLEAWTPDDRPDAYEPGKPWQYRP